MVLKQLIPYIKNSLATRRIKAYQYTVRQNLKTSFVCIVMNINMVPVYHVTLK